MKMKRLFPIPFLLLTGCISSGSFAIPNSPVMPNVIQASWESRIYTLKEDDHAKLKFHLEVEAYSPALEAICKP